MQVNPKKFTAIFNVYLLSYTIYSKELISRSKRAMEISLALEAEMYETNSEQKYHHLGTIPEPTFCLIELPASISFLRRLMLFWKRIIDSIAHRIIKS